MELSGVRRPVTVPVRIRRDGGRPSPDDVRGPAWRRTSRGLYVPAHVEPDRLDQRVVEAAAALPEKSGGVTGWAALAWSRGRWFDGVPWGGGAVRRPCLAIGGTRDIRPQDSFETSEERLGPRELVTVDGVRLTTAARSVVFEMRYAPSLWSAVTTLDMACYDDLVSVEEVAAYAAGLNGWTGIPRCREAIPLASENSWSPAETEFRRIWSAVVPGVPRCNVPVFDLEGRHLGTPDLLDPVTGLVGEYDGPVHFVDGRRGRRELDREHRFRAAGLEPVTMVAGDRTQPEGLVARLCAGLARVQEIPAGRRHWTMQRPPWWTDTSTVAARRALTERERDRLLGYRAA